MKLKKHPGRNECHAQRCKLAACATADAARLCAKHATDVDGAVFDAGKGPEPSPVPEQAHAIVRQARADANEYLEAIAEGFALETQDDVALAVELIDEISDQAKALTEKRMGITRPLDAAKKATMDLFRAPLAALDTAGRKLRKLVADFHDAEQKRNREAVQEGDHEAITSVRDVVGTKLPKVWRFEIVDPDDVDRALCSPDSTLIRAHMNAAVREGKIPQAAGVRFTQETQYRSRRK